MTTPFPATAPHVFVQTGHALDTIIDVIGRPAIEAVREIGFGARFPSCRPPYFCGSPSLVSMAAEELTCPLEAFSAL